ncbi:GNAT family N-acetyltransferase [Bradyrhizobium sp. HKCCYLR1051]|uniref:GNAT family N-acetyltransferase n=1 Tax=Bradyrhizobium sp. HKCCYLR1051 TaxID=3420738 RepID=UPI003EBFBAA2
MPVAISLTHFDHLDNTPAVRLALRGHWETAEAQGVDEVGLHYSYNAILASVDAEPVGVIVWEDQPKQGRIWLQLGYVVPEWRGRGVYSRLWIELTQKARELKRASIWSATGTGNARMRAVAKAQGRREIAVSLRWDVPGEVGA